MSVIPFPIRVYDFKKDHVIHEDIKITVRSGRYLTMFSSRPLGAAVLDFMDRNGWEPVGGSVHWPSGGLPWISNFVHPRKFVYTTELVH